MGLRLGHSNNFPQIIMPISTLRINPAQAKNKSPSGYSHSRIPRSFWGVQLGLQIGDETLQSPSIPLSFYLYATLVASPPPMAASSSELFSLAWLSIPPLLFFFFGFDYGNGLLVVWMRLCVKPYICFLFKFQDHTIFVKCCVDLMGIALETVFLNATDLLSIFFLLWYALGSQQYRWQCWPRNQYNTSFLYDLSCLVWVFFLIGFGWTLK